MASEEIIVEVQVTTTVSKASKRRAEEHTHAVVAKRQKKETLSTISVASTSKPAPKVFPIFEKQTQKSFRFLERLGSNSVLHGIHLNPPARSKVAAFDLDGTLIATKGRGPFPKGKNDWKWWNPVVPERLKALYDDGYAIIIISNQGGLSGVKSIRRESWQIKIDLMAKQISLVPFHIFAAIEDNKYRKPQSGMWSCLTSLFAKDGVVPDLNECFYVGDAAGRPNDHSDADRGLARAIGIRFFTPEEFFLSEHPLSARVEDASSSGTQRREVAADC